MADSPLIIVPGVNDRPQKAPDVWIPSHAMSDMRHAIDHQYDDAQHERKPHGIIFLNGQEVATTLQCPHCGGHFVSRKGSGHRRTFCLKCQAVTCGQMDCDPCRPFAAELERSQGRMV